MNFGKALEALKQGKKIARKGWNGKGGIFARLQLPEVGEAMTSSYACIDTTGLQTDNDAAPRCIVPWVPTQTDMLGEDWQII